jgi:hypothetical protein
VKFDAQWARSQENPIRDPTLKAALQAAGFELPKPIVTEAFRLAVWSTLPFDFAFSFVRCVLLGLRVLIASDALQQFPTECMSMLS